MKTAVDSSILLDLFGGTDDRRRGAERALRRAIEQGALVAGEVVWAEVRAGFGDDPASFHAAMDALGVKFVPTSATAAEDAGRAWRDYRKRGGTRTQLIPDFWVASHARCHADRLLTRDRGFARRFFGDLQVWDPQDPA